MVKIRFSCFALTQDALIRQPFHCRFDRRVCNGWFLGQGSMYIPNRNEFPTPIPNHSHDQPLQLSEWGGITRSSWREAAFVSMVQHNNPSITCGRATVNRRYLSRKSGNFEDEERDPVYALSRLSKTFAIN